MEIRKKWLNLALVAVLTLSLLTPAATAENGANETLSDNETSGTEPSGITEGTTSDTADIEFNTATDEAVLAVIELIDALPTIEEASETNELLIQTARTAYEALTEEQKLNVTNIDLLVQKENTFASLKTNLESSLLSLNHLGEPKGYAYFSMEDFASREDGAEFAEPLGVIIERTTVPFYEGDTIADVTVRTLEENGITPGYGGDTKSGFYLSSIQNFTHNDEFISTFGEFSAGFMSGWMISLNDWFINMGASEFLVTEGDTISWQYTGQMGADIGSDWTNQSAQITGLKISENFGELSPTFDPQVKQYTLTVPQNTQFVQVAAEANKQSRVRYYVEETEYKYLNNIPVEDGTVIKISSIFEDTYSSANDSDEIFITIQDESAYKINAVVGLINALPTITLADEATQLQLQQARAAYNALTEEQKNLVSNVNELVNKENYFKTLKNVQELEQQISNLPTVETLQWTDKNEVEQVAVAYEALTEEVQSLITNYDKLETLQKRLIELQTTAITTEQAYNTVGQYMAEKLPTPTFGNEWFILTLARGNYAVPTDYYDTYYNNVVDYVKSVDGNLHARKYTEYSRLILALTAIGKDPTNVGGYNLVEKLSDFDKVVWQGVNGAYYGLIALDTWGFELPETATTTREKLINFILSKQLADGGFALSGTKADPDMTAMAIQSLAPYYNQGNVKIAIDTAVNTLATMQLANGGYGSWGVENAESATQVIAALVSLGIDPAKDARFNKVIPNVMTYYSETDGGFKHVLSEKKANGMATEQVGYTLAAYNRLLNGQSSLYNMVDTKPVVPEQPNSGETAQPETDETEQPNLGENEQPKLDETEQPNLGESEQPKLDETEQPNLGETEQPKLNETVQPKPEQAYGYSTFSIVISSSEVPLAPVTTEIFEGETVFDVLKRVTAENSVSLSYRDSTYGIYIEEINGLYEFDRGPESGWMYRVNGVFPSYSAALHVLQPGDRVEWLYTTNLGKDVGGYVEDIEKEPAQVEQNPNEDKETSIDIPTDKTALQTAITDAEVNKGSVKISIDGKDVEPTEKWVTQGQLDAYASIIQSAQQLIADENTTQDAIDAKVLALNQATEAFNQAKQTGTKSNVNTSTQQVYNTVGQYMVETLPNPTFGNEWFILTLARGNYSVPTDYYDTYYNNVVEYVKSVDGNLHARKYTEYSRLILALTAIGKDPTNVGGYNLVEKLADFDKVVWQGVNGAYYGLIALDTWGFELPETATTTREKLIDFILSKQLPDGGFALSGTKADPDMTAMAIQSLAPYYNQGNVKAAIDTAVNTLATMQSANGGYGSWGVENVESATQVIAALVSLGIDPAKDTRFNKVIPNILTYYSETDGGFKHVLSEKKANGMATEQVGYTLAAYNRLLNGQSSLYNMLDTKPAAPEQPKPGETEQPKPIETEKPKPSENVQPKPSIPVQPKPEQAYGNSTFSIVISSSEVPLAPVTTEIFEGETVFDVLKRVTAENSVSLSYRDSTYGIYIEGINGLYEFDRGPESGWMYRVNGAFPSYSAALHVLQPGDRVEWLYTTNLGKDVGGYIEDIEKEPGQTEQNLNKDKDKEQDKNQDKDKETNLELSKEDNKEQEDIKTVINVDAKEGTTETSFTAEDIKQYTQNNVTTIVVQDTQGAHLEVPTSTLSSIYLKEDEKIVTAVTTQAEGKQIDVNLSIETADGTTKAISTGKAYAKITLPITDATENTVVLQSVNGEYKAVPHKIVDGEIIILTKTGGTFVVMEETVTFKDIAQTFNKEEIEFLASRHIIKGVNADEFEPNKPITRAQFAVMISRALGLQTSGENTFNDTKGQWYEQDVQALFEAGITTGKTADTFDPEAHITRQQAAAFMARVLSYVNFQAQSSTEANFNDANEISAEFKPYIDLLNSLNIMTGKADGTFDPHSSLTRAQMAKILKRTLNVANLI